MKTILVSLLLFLLLFSIAGCGVRQKLEEKAGEAILEKMIGDEGGDIDIDGDKVVVKGEDGEEITFGSTEWPTSDLAKSIPELKSGEVISVIESKDGVLISLEGVPEKDFTPYLDGIKATFTEDAYNLGSDDSTTYGAKNAQGLIILIMYGADETLSISLSREAE